jgi:hypothetical protein
MQGVKITNAGFISTDPRILEISTTINEILSGKHKPMVVGQEKKVFHIDDNFVLARIHKFHIFMNIYLLILLHND